MKRLNAGGPIDGTRRTKLGLILALAAVGAACGGGGSEGAASSTSGDTGTTTTGTTGSGTTGANGSGSGTATSGMGGAATTTDGSASTSGSTGTTGTSGSGQGGTGIENVQPATFTIDASLSPEIPTVGIVQWSVDQTIDSATIQFGRDGMVEYTAPVDLAEDNYRTLLLGMKQGETYVLRVVASGGGVNYVSQDVTLEAGFISNSLPTISVTDVVEGASFGGLTVSCNGVGGAAPGEDTAASWAFIFDRDGDYVWGYDLAGTPAQGCSRARMSEDGKYLWAGTFSNTTSENTNGALMRVSMDGLDVTTYTTDPTGDGNFQVENINRRHHDFTILPSGNVLFYERKGDGDNFADQVMELDPATGNATLVYDEETDLADLQRFHTNYITYIPDMNAFSISMRHSNTIALLSYPDAQLLGVFSGVLDQFGVSWEAQHGHQFVDGKLLVFNNTNSGPANILSFSYDLDSKTSGEIETYTGGPQSIAFGDVQRLPNGNTFITYSNVGVFHEVDASNQLVKTFETDPLGYAEHRATLYGPPPHLE